MQTSRYTHLAMLAALLCTALGARAGEALPEAPGAAQFSDAAAPGAAGAGAAPVPGPPQADGAMGPKAGPERLSLERGGADTISNEAKLDGVVTGNTAVNVSTGMNIIDGGSFANASGIPIVIQNTGANVLIQNATVVNLQLR